MARKKSVRKSAQYFQSAVREIETYLAHCDGLAGFKHHEYAYDYAVLWLYMEFEYLVLQALIGAINNNAAATISAQTGISFPRNLSDEACEYLISNGDYFALGGTGGLKKYLKKLLPSTHYVRATLSDPKYTPAVERLIALRNFAAHGSLILPARPPRTQAPRQAGCLTSVCSWPPRARQRKWVCEPPAWRYVPHGAAGW